jgi:hypothetical protein
MNAEELRGLLFVAVALGEGGDEGGLFAAGQIERLTVLHLCARAVPVPHPATTRSRIHIFNLSVIILRII